MRPEFIPSAFSPRCDNYLNFAGAKSDPSSAKSKTLGFQELIDSIGRSNPGMGLGSASLSSPLPKFKSIAKRSCLKKPGPFKVDKAAKTGKR